MPYSEYRPELMGSATLTPSGPIEAGSWQSFTLVYTAGQFGIDDTGSIKIGMRFATDFGPVQFDDPAAPGYTTVVASNGATLDCRWEFKRNIRPWSRSLYIGVQKHFLREGDTITINFGDQSGGSKGVRVQTYCEKVFEFKVFVDAIATYDYVALPVSPHIDIIPGPPVTWQAALPTLRRAGEKFRLSIKGEDAWGNPSHLVNQTFRLDASSLISGLPEQAHFQADEFALIVDDLSITEADENIVVRVLDENSHELCHTNPLRVVDTAERVHYWGDLHGQSNETLGTNTAEAYFHFARDRAFLDVCSHQGNDFQMTQEFWRDLNQLTADLNEPGRFVTFPGYEWSANTAIGGDRNVFYRNEGRPMYRSSHAQIADLCDEDTDAHDAHGLFQRLENEDCVCWAHCGGRFADITYAHDGRLEASVEVHSSWGTFEWLLHDAFSKNYRVGVVCNSDGHKGRPGASFPGASFFGAYGGLTCYIASELTRDGIFEAMRARRHYGTTGNRMFLDLSVHSPGGAERFSQDPLLFTDAKSDQVDALLMGDIARVAADEVTLSLNANGSAPIEKIDVFDGTDLIHTHRPSNSQQLGNRVRLTYSGAEYRGRSRTTTWDGSLKVDGTTIQDAAMFNNWNLDRGIHNRTNTALEWRAVTTGNYGGIDLTLAEATGSISLKTAHAEMSASISELSANETICEAGGLDRRLTLQRLPQSVGESRANVELTVPVKKEGDTRLFVRVQQIDGHRAWTSPVYLFR